MAWIELHQSVFTHRKTLALADILGLSEVYAAGHVTALWCWSLDNAPEGMLPASRRVIARAAYWPGDPDAFVQALVEVGYLDQEGDRLCIHDWESYAGRLIGQRRANAEKQRAWRDRQQQSRNDNSNDNSNGDITVTLPLRNGATVPYPTVPNSTEPKEEETRATKAARPSIQTSYPEGFEVTDEMRAKVRAKYPDLDIDAATEEWAGAMCSNRRKYRYTDWTQAWYGAMRRANEWGASAKGGGNKANGQTVHKGAAAARRNLEAAARTLSYLDQPDKHLPPGARKDTA